MVQNFREDRLLKEMTVYRKDKTEMNRKINAVPGVIGAILLICIVCGAVSMLFWFYADRRSVTVSENMTAPKYSAPVVVIDAGHGGIDGGAVGADGTLEKEINLAVAKRLEAICCLTGVECVMTREEDSLLADESMKRFRKMTDLKNRLEVVKRLESEGKSPILISIHMNNFSSPEYSGLQVWYSPNSERSAVLANCLQDYAKNYIDSANNRKVKKAGSAIYMLDRVTSPAVLVECGFLSNTAEREMLKSEAYQTKLAVVIYSAVCEYSAG